MATNDKHSDYKAFNIHGVAKVPFRTDNVQPGRGMGSKTLSSYRRKVLEDILKREALAEKRSKLHAVLSQKLMKKHGSEHLKVIKRVVSSFLEKNQHITADDLKSLEKETQSAIANAIEAAKVRGPASAKQIAETIAEPATISPRLPTPPKGKEWQLMLAYQDLVAEEKVKKQQRDNWTKKQQFKNDLDEHVKMQQSMKESEKRDAVRYNQYINEDIVKFQQEESQKIQKTKEKYFEEKKIREEQILERQKRKAEEIEQSKKEEAARNQAALDLIEREKQTLLEIKLRERKRQEAIAKENLENLQKLSERRKEEAAEDHRLMQMYAAKLDKEAKERETAFQRRLANLEAFAKKYHHEGAGKKEREDGLKFEALLVKEIQNKIQKDQEDEKLRLESKKNKELQAARENAKLLERKRQERENTRKNDELLARKYQSEASEYQQQLQMERLKHIEKQKKYRTMLDQHMTLRKMEDINLTGMAEKEKRINLPELKKMQQDKDLYLKVIRKIGMKVSP